MHIEGRNGASIDRIYLHTNEGPQGPNAAQNLAGYLSRIDGGYHVIVDDADTVRVVQDGEVVWAEGGDNSHALSICFIGYAASTDWTTPYSKAMIERAVWVAAAWVRQYNIPVRRVDPGAPGQPPTERGIAEHADDHSPASEGHTDPGSRFPIDDFIKQLHDQVFPQIDWEALKKLHEWEDRTSKTPLALGMRGPDVQLLNLLLIQHGYSGVAGDAYGTHTATAVAAFKVKAGLPNHDGTKFGADAAAAILK
jgi:N-acetyl-anhydromuramyl-L-alanine amidase AmpD